MPDTTPSRLQLHDTTDGDVTVVHVGGELDPHSAPTLAEHLDAVLGGGARQVDLDLADLRFVDSSGLRVLLGTSQQLAAAGGELWLRNPGRTVRRLLDVAGVGEALPVRAG